MKITHQSHEHCFLQWAFQFNSTFKRLIPTSERTTFHCTQLLPARMRSLWNFWGEWNPFETLLAPLTSLWSLHRAFPPPGLLLGILGRGEAPTNPDRCANKGRACQGEAQFCPSCGMQQNKAHSTMSFLSPFLVFFTLCILFRHEILHPVTLVAKSWCHNSVNKQTQMRPVGQLSKGARKPCTRFRTVFLKRY